MARAEPGSAESSSLAVERDCRNRARELIRDEMQELMGRSDAQTLLMLRGPASAFCLAESPPS